MSNERVTVPSSLVTCSTHGSVTSLSRLSKFVSSRTIEPWDSWYRRWWFFTTLCALATAIFTPWEVAFTNEPGLSPYTDAPAMVEYFLTAVFVMDIFVQLNVAYISHEGRLEFSRKAIATHYLKFMFWIDLLGVIPVNSVVEIFVNTDSAQRRLALLRLFRLVRAHRLWALSRDFELNIRLHLVVITILRNFVIVIVANHWAACAFYYIARRYGFDQDTWLGANFAILHDAAQNDAEVMLIQGNAIEGSEIPLPRWQKYVYALYWSLTTMTTVGYGDLTPENIAEVIFTMVYMLFNIALYSYVLGTITLVVIKTDEMTSRQRRGHEKLDRFAAKHRLHDATLKDLNKHLKFNYLHPEIQDSELMINLPSNLRRRVMFELYGERLAKTDCSKVFIASLLEPHDDNRPAVHNEVYKSGDEIVTENEFATFLFVLLTGQARVGQHDYGELDAFPVELFMAAPDFDGSSQEFQFSPYTVTASTTCRVLCIHRRTLVRSFQAFPRDWNKFQRTAVEYVQRRDAVFSASTVASNRPSMTSSVLQLNKSSTVRFEPDCLNEWEIEEDSPNKSSTDIKADSDREDDVELERPQSPNQAANTSENGPSHIEYPFY